MKENQNEELQSRREFFKKAAKAALPVVGAVVMASLPLEKLAATTCTGTCHGYCHGSCTGCQYTCTGSCKNSCRGGCAVSAKY